jgi:hypothetical protein
VKVGEVATPPLNGSAGARVVPDVDEHTVLPGPHWKNCTVPVGVPSVELPVTVATSCTSWPNVNKVEDGEVAVTVGAAVGVVVDVAVLQVGTVMVLSSRVTAPFRASTRPSTGTPVSSVAEV